jgi:hypothetical protein
VHATGRHDPKAAALASPPLGLSKQSDEPAQIAICHGGFGGDKCLPRFVINIHGSIIVIICHRRPHRRSFGFLVQDSLFPYSIAFRRLRQTITSSTTTAKAPATTRIKVTVSILVLLRF